jgi:hypothetical protein
MTPISSCGWLEGDVVSEGLEAGDEAFGVAFGVAALKEVAAELAVGLMGNDPDIKLRLVGG